MREFEAHVGIQLVRGHLVEQLMIELRAGARLLDVGDVFPEIVDADANAPAVEFRRHPDRVLYLISCHEATGKLLSDG